MAIKESYVHGTPNWIDISSSNLEAAKDFYTAVLGWEYEDRPLPDGGVYVMVMKNGKSVAGMSQAGEQNMGMADVWNMYIAVDDADAATAAAVEAGATAMFPPMDVMDQGRMSFIQDPVGAFVGLWQGNAHKGAEVVNEHGCFVWSEVVTEDTDKAFEFYKSLGLTGVSQPMGEGEPYTGFMVGENMVCGTMKPPMDGVPPHWHIYFAVDDCEAAVAAAKAAGGSVVNGPFDTPVGPMAVLGSPEGTTFSVMQMAQM